jgi:hypothetical protein
VSTQPNQPKQPHTLVAFFLPVLLAFVAATLALVLIPICTLLVYALSNLSPRVEEAQRSGNEFLWRRLSETPELFGEPLDISPLLWYPVGWLVLLGAFFLVFFFYVREVRSIGWLWAGFLALLRSAVVLSFFLIWLLPATRMVEWSEQRSRVLLGFDVSASVQSSDEAPDEMPGQVRRTRQELVLDFLAQRPSASATERLVSRSRSPSDPTAPAPPTTANFLQALTRNNPLYCYRFGEQLDPTPWVVARTAETPEAAETAGNPLPSLTFADWSRKLRPNQRGSLAEPLSPELVAELVQAGKRAEALESAAAATGEERSKEAAAVAADIERALQEQQRLRERLLNRTNPGASLLELLRKESGNMVQGVILFSDGRKTAGSDQELADALKEARRAKIPVFTVGVGDYREILNLRLVDVLAPGRVQPEDEFPVRVAVEGENTPQQQEVKVVLKIEKPGLPPERMEQQIALAGTSARLASGAAEFRVTNPDKLKGDWKLIAHVEPLKGERTRGDNVSEEPRIVKVEDRKLAVLLMTSTPSREYQFLRNLIVREGDKFDLTIWLQGAAPGAVQDIDPKKMLDQFPTDLRDRDEDPMNLGKYDVVVAIDPDWRQVPWPSKETQGKATPQENLKRWVEDFAGGLVLVAGQVHTFDLARDKDLGLIRDLYPVVLDESASSFQVMDRPSKEPWAVNWGPTAPQQPYLDLTDSGDRTKVLEGWEEFFEVPRDPETNQAETPAKRGFHVFFPLRDAKPAATVLARFSDPDRRYLTPQSHSRQPFFVTQTVGKGPVFYIGSGETYRLRQFSEKYHERFWTKLLRQIGKGDQSRGSRRGLLVVGSRYVEGDTVEVEAQLFDAEMKPLKVDDKTPVRLKVQSLDGLTDLPRDWTDGLPLKADTARPGWYQVRFPVRRSGRYALEVKVPGSIEVLTGKLRVESIDPERDDTRPNFALLHRIASETKEIQLLDERRRPAFQQALAAAKERVFNQVRSGAISAKELTPENESERLFFDLDTAGWIAECLRETVVPYRTEGKVTDLWDKGWTVFANLEHPDQATGPPWALILIVVLLSGEWLTRKLIKLA